MFGADYTEKMIALVSLLLCLCATLHGAMEVKGIETIAQLNLF